MSYSVKPAILTIVDCDSEAPHIHIILKSVYHSPQRKATLIFGLRMDRLNTKKPASGQPAGRVGRVAAQLSQGNARGSNSPADSFCRMANNARLAISTGMSACWLMILAWRWIFALSPWKLFDAGIWAMNPILAKKLNRQRNRSVLGPMV